MLVLRISSWSRPMFPFFRHVRANPSNSYAHQSLGETTGKCCDDSDRCVLRQSAGSAGWAVFDHFSLRMLCLPLVYLSRRSSSYSLYLRSPLSAKVRPDYASPRSPVKASAVHSMPLIEASRVSDPVILLDAAPSHLVGFYLLSLLCLMFLRSDPPSAGVVATRR